MPSNTKFLLQLPTSILLALIICRQLYFVTAAEGIQNARDDGEMIGLDEQQWDFYNKQPSADYSAVGQPDLVEDPAEFTPAPDDEYLLSDVEHNGSGPFSETEQNSVLPEQATEPSVRPDISTTSVPLETRIDSSNTSKTGPFNGTDFSTGEKQPIAQPHIDASNATDVNGQPSVTVNNTESIIPLDEGTHSTDKIENGSPTGEGASNAAVYQNSGTVQPGIILTEQPTIVSPGTTTKNNLAETNQTDEMIHADVINATNGSDNSLHDNSTVKLTTSNATATEKDADIGTPDLYTLIQNTPADKTNSSQSRTIKEETTPTGSGQVKAFPLVLEEHLNNINKSTKNESTNPNDASINEEAKTLLEQLHSIKDEVNQLKVALDEEDPWTEETKDNQNAERLSEALDDLMYGVTKSFRELRHLLHSTRTEHEWLEVHFNDKMKASLYRHLLIRTRDRLHEILKVMLSFHDDEGRALIDEDDGRPIRYESSRHRLGHIIDILHHGFSYSRVKLSIKLKPKSQLEADDLIFHFAHASGIHNNIPSANISGPNQIFIDSSPQIFSESVKCHIGAGCRWELDSDVVANVSDRSVGLVFHEYQMGNRILAYVARTETERIILASIRLSILPNPNIKCFPLPRTPRNQWLEAGAMITPRADFTMTYLPHSQAILIVGGTADGSTPLKSYEYFNVSTGCFSQSNMTYARMKHTATYVNESDFVIIIGGQGSDLQLMAETEFIWPFGNQVYKNITAARYSHVTSLVMGSKIYIVAGRGPTNASDIVEVFHWQDEPSAASTPKRKKRLSSQSLLFNERALMNNIEGHSVTFFDEPPSVFIFGGRNDINRAPIAHVFDGENLFIVFSTATLPGIPQKLAHHQTVYLPEIESGLITGGDDGARVYQSSYLISKVDGLFNMTGSMRRNRSYHVAVKLTNGSVLVIGGIDTLETKSYLRPLDSVERYDPSIEKFTYTNPLKTARYGHIALHVPDDTVIVCGGRGVNGQILKDCEILMY